MSTPTTESLTALDRTDLQPTHVETSSTPELKHYPTMESLFGSLDFCECEHCRSVLSPAAYFVDLLQFLNPEDEEWNWFLNEWKDRHKNEAYPHTHPETKQPLKPYDALVLRRPDLPHLPLTCENTHTALPYIDVVNEILEYWIANKMLDQNAVHDTGDSTTPELLAEPQHIIPNAYLELRDARYPLALPFDLWLETVRRFFEHFETPLWRVLEVFRPTDELFATAANPKAYYRAAIFAEYLGISPAEYAIFTDSNPLAKWFELYGYKTKDEATDIETDDNDQRIDLNSAKALSRRLRVTYKELVEILRTWFVNPQLDNLVFLKKHGIDVKDVFLFKQNEGLLTKEESSLSQQEAELLSELHAIEKRLLLLTGKFNPNGDPSGFNASTWIDTVWNNGGFNQILVLADPNTGCSFDQTTLQYANGNPADALDFLKINLFVRLWKKLGWTIEEIDRTLRVSVPASSLPLTGVTLGAAVKTALLYLAHLKVLSEQVRVGKNGRQKLLTLWSNLPTTGKNPLYAQLFLTPSVLKDDPDSAFDDPLGEYLSKPDVLITSAAKDHLPALQAALNLTADEIGTILADAEKKLDIAELSLDNVSLLYRYGLLAKALKLPVGDLITLKGLAGLNPFELLSPNPVATLAEDHPFSQTLLFVELAEKVKESGFQVEDVNYLLRHRFDPVGKYRPDDAALLAMVKSLASEIDRIQAEHAVPTNPGSLTDDLLRQKLALVLPPEVVETFFAMWTGTVEYEAVFPPPPALGDVLAEDQLDPAAFAAELAIRVSYDPVRLVQRLTFRGVLLEEKKAQLKAAFPSLMVGALLDAVHKKATDFFEKQLQKSSDAPFGFLAASDFNSLFGPMPPLPDGLTDQEKEMQKEVWMDGKRATLALAFFPFLQQKLTSQLVVQILATSLNADPALVGALVTNASLLTDPSQPAKPLLDAFAVVKERGVSVAFFNNVGASLGTETRTAAGTADKPLGTHRARFEGYVEVPATGAYRFFAVFGNQSVEAEFRLVHMPDPVISYGAAKDNGEASQFVELKHGVPYVFTFDARNLAGGDVALLVQSERLPKSALSQLTLYPQAAIDRISRAQVLLAKTLQLIQGFALSEREIRHFLTHPADFAIDLSKLPARIADDSPAGAKALFAQFLRLADYARLKRDLAQGTDDLIVVIENARRTYSEVTDPEKAEETKTVHFEPIAHLMRRDATTIRTTAERSGFTVSATSDANGFRVETPDLANEKGISRLWEVLQAVEKLGVPVDAILRWATPNPEASTAGDLRNTVKARYEPENWRRIAQSIFDKLRQRQRDALVAYVLQNHPEKFTSINQLFEYFLIDPGMEPVVQTSRLRLAISSVQLFVQRCLLSLEKRVHPSAIINSNHWQWMKRYRVWEANRKIFLWPENWLEPEFRDDKTHLFQELESALLQGDVSNDLVEDAFFNYLKKLQEIARLDIVSMYCEEKPDADSNIYHVIGRTFSSPRKYFYRRYAAGMWTPWEPVTAEIDADYVVAVVWRERLHLFWVTFLDKAEPDSKTAGETVIPDDAQAGAAVKALSTMARMAPLKKVEVQLNWNEYFQGEWTAPESSDFVAPNPDQLWSDFNSSSVPVDVTKEYDAEGEERELKIHLRGGVNKAFSVVSKNSRPKIVVDTDDVPLARCFLYYDRLYVHYVEEIKVTQFVELETGEVAFKPILSKIDTEDSYLTLCNDPKSRASLNSLFFYKDDRNTNTFFVEPSVTLTPIPQGAVSAFLTEFLNIDSTDLTKEIVPNQVPEPPGGPPENGWTDLAGKMAKNALYKIPQYRDSLPETVHFDQTSVGLRGGLGTTATSAGGMLTSALLEQATGGGFAAGFIKR